MKKSFEIKGMHCNSCAEKIENDLKEDVSKITVNFSKSRAEIEYDENRISEKQIKERVKKLGFEVIEKSDTITFNFNHTILIVVVFIVLVFLLFIGLDFGVSGIKIPDFGESASLVLLFAVGLLTGFHCISMCGGFIVTYTTKNASRGHRGYKQHLLYGGSKVISYAVIGGIFGLIGGMISFSVGLRGAIAIIAGIFMVFYALSMFGLKFFRRFQFHPRFLSKVASKEHKGYYRGPMITGLLSGLFIACGPLQAMYFYAAGTGSFITGLIALTAFGLGTLPLLLGFGGLTSIVSYKTTKKILMVSAILVLLLGVVMINRGLELTGSPISFSSITAQVSGSKTASIENNGYQEINMTINGGVWSPNVFVLKKSVPVKWNINVVKPAVCNDEEILINQYNIDAKLNNTGLSTIEFIPNETGTIKWSCWMGMITGSFIVTDTGTADQQQIDTQIHSTSGSSPMG